MNTTPMSNCTYPPESEPELPPMPVETEIYILPTGEVVVADLPAELAAYLASWNPGDPGPAPDPRGE